MPARALLKCGNYSHNMGNTFSEIKVQVYESVEANCMCFDFIVMHTFSQQTQFVFLLVFLVNALQNKCYRFYENILIYIQEIMTISFIASGKVKP